MKIMDIRKKTTTELASEVTATREEIAEMRRRLHTGEVQNVRIIRNKKRDLARLLTVLGEQLAKENA